MVLSMQQSFLQKVISFWWFAIDSRSGLCHWTPLETPYFWPPWKIFLPTPLTFFQSHYSQNQGGLLQSQGGHAPVIQAVVKIALEMTKLYFTNFAGSLPVFHVRMQCTLGLQWNQGN